MIKHRMVLLLDLVGVFLAIQLAAYCIGMMAELVYSALWRGAAMGAIYPVFIRYLGQGLQNFTPPGIQACREAS